MIGVDDSATSIMFGITTSMPSSFGLAFGLLPSKGPGCNLNLMGLWGLAGAGDDLGLPNLVGVGKLDSLVVG